MITQTTLGESSYRTQALRRLLGHSEIRSFSWERLTAGFREPVPHEDNMNKHDRAKMFEHLSRIGISRDALNGLGAFIENTVDGIVRRSVDRAVRAERKAQQDLRNVCHDCKDVLVNEGPVLCQGCLETRMTEGMDHDDMRTIQAWRKS